MEKYVRVDWPESQKWATEEGVELGANGMHVFVPEELYKQSLVRTKRPNLYLKPVNNE